jgi:NAD(P)H-flavin reductase
MTAKRALSKSAASLLPRPGALFACGPTPMLKAVATLARARGASVTLGHARRVAAERSKWATFPAGDRVTLLQVLGRA